MSHWFIRGGPGEGDEQLYGGDSAVISRITQKLEEEKPSNRHSVSVVQTLRSRTVLLLAGAVFCDYFAAYAIIFWLPTILKR